MMHLSPIGGGIMSAYSQLNPNYPNVFAVLFVLPVSTWRVYVTSYKSQPAQSSQSKAVIARYLGNAQMWLQANEQMKSAVGIPWYRKS
jgi:hypothetical protein